MYLEESPLSQGARRRRRVWQAKDRGPRFAAQIVGRQREAMTRPQRSSPRAMRATASCSRATSCV